MAGTMMVNKKLLDRLRAAFKRYGSEILGDPNITIDFFPTDFEGYFGVFLSSPNFQSMSEAERQDSVWDYLDNDPEITDEDLHHVTQIATENEAVEII